MKSLYRPVVGAFLAACLAFASPGCRTSFDTYDMDYPAYGGAWQRTNRECGRVGSLFDPAGGKVASLVDRDEPPTPDVMERLKNSGSTDPDRQENNRDSDGAPSDVRQEVDPTDELMQRRLEDIKEEKEDELRQRQLEDIEIRVKRSAPQA